MSMLAVAANQSPSHILNCDCAYCQNNPTKPLNEPENWYSKVASMPRERKDYFDDNKYESASESGDDQRNEEAIRQAPYLPKIQVWARPEGPYTLRIGKQWFHCDDLIINGAEYRQKRRPSADKPRTPGASNGAVYPLQNSRGKPRPMASRAQSYQRTRPDKQPTTAVSSVESSPRSSGGRLASEDQYQPQILPTPKEQAEKRKAEKRRQKEAEAQKLAIRNRRDSGTAMAEESQDAPGALVPYKYAPPAEAAQHMRQLGPSASRPARPNVLRRQSSRNNSYQRPVKRAGGKAVRFALPT